MIATVLKYTVLWIRIFWLSWFRIRIGNADPDTVRVTDTIVYDFLNFSAFSFEGTVHLHHFSKSQKEITKQ